MKRAKKHLEKCEDKECRYCTNGRCCFGLRYVGCIRKSDCNLINEMLNTLTKRYHKFTKDIENKK